MGSGLNPLQEEGRLNAVASVARIESTRRE
jgi:hypothetical protein